VPSPYIGESPHGKLVALTDENAGSDGDIFSHAFKMLNLGPLVGKRTWGGVIGISPYLPLADGTVTTQPEFTFWFKDVGWGVENYGTDPTIEVDYTPQDYTSGAEAQRLAESSPAPTLALFVDTRNAGAIQLYRRGGFEDFSKPVKRKGYSLQRMLLKLNREPMNQPSIP